MTRTQARLGAVLAALVLATGCGTADGNNPGDPPGGKAEETPSPAGARFTADQLTEALLPDFEKLVWTADPQAGEYGSLPITPRSSLDPKNIPAGVTFSPDKCRGIIWSGPDLEQFRTSPTAFVQLADPAAVREGKDSVLAWNILIATAGQPRKAALGAPKPGCSEVKTTYKGSSMTFEEKTPPKIGKARRAALLTPSGESQSPKAWIVAFVEDGYVGMIVLEGPTNEKQVNAFAKAAFEKARQTLG